MPANDLSRDEFIRNLKVMLVDVDNELDNMYVGIQLPEHPWFKRLKEALAKRNAIRLALKNEGQI